MFALVPLPAWALASASAAISPSLSLATARGASVAGLSLGCAIPLARARPPVYDDGPAVPADACG